MYPGNCIRSDAPQCVRIKRAGRDIAQKLRRPLPSSTTRTAACWMPRQILSADSISSELDAVAADLDLEVGRPRCSSVPSWRQRPRSPVR